MTEMFPTIPVWDRALDPPKAQDIVLADNRYWVVYYIVHPSNRFVCFRNSERRTFELDEIHALIKASPDVCLSNGALCTKLRTI